MALESNMRDQLQNYFSKLVNPIEIYANIDEGIASIEMMELLNEISGLTEKIEVKLEKNASNRIPSFSVNRKGEVTGIEFAGIPLGQEFTSLVLALLQVSGYPPKIELDKMERIKSIPEKLHFETYISLSCHICPDIVQSLNIMSVLNKTISHSMIDGSLFQDEINERKIMVVPTIFLNGEYFGEGRMEFDEILAKVDVETTAQQVEKLSKLAPYDVLVVGGGPAGASAAIYAARKGIRIAIVAERFGGQVMETDRIENFISVKATSGPKLAASLKEHLNEYGVELINLQGVASLNKVENMVEIGLASGVTLKSKTVIISTGARWRELGVPGEREFRSKGVAYCPHCDGPIFKGKRVAVIGGGNSGVEAAIDLAGIVEHVTLLEFAPELKADAVLRKRLISLPNIDIIVNVVTNEFSGTDKVSGLTYTHRETLQQQYLEIEGVFIQIGLVPNTDWLRGTLELNSFGEIIIDSNGATSISGVFAAGDCTNVPYKQIIIAMGEGAKASLSAFDYIIRND